jgi:ABC-type uncharacterized transport system involved in gliding motility auxiliary subunit
MKRMSGESKTYRGKRIATLILAAVLFMAVNVAATAFLTSSRIDLTEQHLYTLSDGTKKIIKDLKEPVTLTLYFSAKTSAAYPYLKSYGQRIRDLLSEYASLSDGKIKFTVVDPEPFTPAEDAVVAAGLKAVQTPGGEQLYLGLIGANGAKAEQVIPFFARERENFLEYDLSKLIDQLANPKRPVVGLLTSLPMQFGPGGALAAVQGQSKPYAIFQQLQQSFTVRQMTGPFKSIAPDVDLLIIAHPVPLGDQELYAIDQFVLRGGRALVFVDPYLEASATSAGGEEGQIPASSSLDKLFAAWGIHMEAGKVVADRGLAQKVGVIGANGARETKDYLPWLAVGKASLNASDLVTADLTVLNLASAGVLTHDPKSITSFTPLISSSKDAEVMDAATLMLVADPDLLMRQFKPSGQSYVMAARLTGPAKSAFTAPPPPAATQPPALAQPGTPQPAAAAPEQPYQAQSKAGINVIVVADADMLEDRFWVQDQDYFGQAAQTPIADNGAFVLDAADNLSGSGNLISLRSRGVSNRPFTVVDNIRKRAESNFLIEEKRLEEKLEGTEKQMKALEAASSGPQAGKLNAAQSQALESFRQDIIKTRQEIRDVQHRMRRDIETLGRWLKFINIGLIPLLIIVTALGLAYLRHRRRSRG